MQMKKINNSWTIGLAGLIIGSLLTMFVMRSGSHHGHADHQHRSGQGSGTNEETIWTCSMHPSIRQPEPGDCPICGMDLIPAGESDNDDPLVLQMTDEAVKLANIQTTIVNTGGASSEQSLRLSGKVQSDERLASSQVAQVGGRIEKLYVSFTGEQVREGQKLADIYAPELITAQRDLLEANKLAGLNPKLVEAARTKLRYWKISDEQIATIEASGEIQETFPVRATASGVVTNRRVAVGDYIRQGEPLFDLIGLQRVWVLFDAYEEDLAKLRLGSKITFTTPAIPATTFQASVSFIDPIINARTRTASVRVELNNPRGQLKPEMLVNGTLEQNTSSNTKVMAPKSAVLWTGARSVVYVKIPDTDIPSFQFREVELGEAIGNKYEITNGLTPGEEIVTYGGFVIDAAAQLNNQASMMNQEVLLKKEDSGTAIPDYTADTPEDFRLQIKEVVSSYLDLKDALVETDADAAAEQATNFGRSLSKVDMNLLLGAAHEYWMEQLPALKAHSSKIGKLEDVEAQRTQFDFLSQAMIQVVKAFGLQNETYYVQYCPMAFNDQGAAWLSAEDQVLNPYFGDVMLRCGVIQETLAPQE